MLLLFVISIVDDSSELEQSAPKTRLNTVYRELVWELFEEKLFSTIRKIIQVVRANYVIAPLTSGLLWTKKVKYQ